MEAEQSLLVEDDAYEEISFRVPKIETDHVRGILNRVLPEVIELFVIRSNGYGEPDADDLGVPGQFADMHRKFKVLRRVMWEGKPPPSGSETLEERLMDLIGHCLKSIQFIREKR